LKQDLQGISLLGRRRALWGELRRVQRAIRSPSTPATGIGPVKQILPPDQVKAITHMG
jgi:hypothetical protein